LRTRRLIWKEGTKTLRNSFSWENKRLWDSPPCTKEVTTSIISSKTMTSSKTKIKLEIMRNR
jgi:hypothetical protein